MQRLEDTSSFFGVTMAIAGYSLCSSTLLLANKLSMEYLPSPSLVSFIQIVFATIAVLILKWFGYEVDWFEWDKVKAYSVYVVIFIATIYTNMQALANSNVETVIVFRACSPIAVGVVEYLFMNRELPSIRSTLSLCVLVFGAAIYCLSDSQAAVNGIGAYFWAILYFFLITLEMTYGKVLTSSVNMNSVWGPVLYCNALSVLPMLCLSYVAGDFAPQMWARLSVIPPWGVVVLLFSCLVGTLIGYTGWLCRGMVSATTFTLVGVVNKFITVLLNVAIWDKHSTPLGLLAVCLCLGSGSLYQQAPRRAAARKEGEEETHVLLDAEQQEGEHERTTGESGVELLAVVEEGAAESARTRR